MLISSIHGVSLLLDFSSSKFVLKKTPSHIIQQCLEIKQYSTDWQGASCEVNLIEKFLHGIASSTILFENFEQVYIKDCFPDFVKEYNSGVWGQCVVSRTSANPCERDVFLG